jgi:hypothetical protein
MTSFRFIPLAVAIGAAGVLAGCTTAPAMPTTTAPAMAMHSPDQMAKMDAQMKSMHAMHEKMMTSKTPEERNAMMAAHMKSMQDGMAMMKGMQGMPADMAGHHQMMEKRMEMTQSMMEMMMDRMPAVPAK